MAKISKCITLSTEADNILKEIDNQSGFINKLILESIPTPGQGVELPRLKSLARHLQEEYEIIGSKLKKTTKTIENIEQRIRVQKLARLELDNKALEQKKIDDYEHNLDVRCYDCPQTNKLMKLTFIKICSPCFEARGGLIRMEEIKDIEPQIEHFYRKVDVKE